MRYAVKSPLAAFALLLIHGATAAVLAQAAQVSIKLQPEAPILISVVRFLSGDPRAPQFEYSVMNKSDRPIRAFTLLHHDGGLSGSTMSLLSFPLTPGQSQAAEYGNETSSEPIKAIEMSVDFVEFADGTVWGPDVTQSADQLKGTRAGMVEERDPLLKTLTEGGKTDLIQAFSTDGAMPAPPLGHSQKWERGFRTGARQFRMRIRRIHREDGFTAAESELRQPLHLKER